MRPLFTVSSSRFSNVSEISRTRQFDLLTYYSHVFGKAQAVENDGAEY
jgi:hypothetical protein